MCMTLPVIATTKIAQASDADERAHPSDCVQAHQVSKFHVKRQIIALYKAEFEARQTSREVISVSHAEGMNFGIVNLQQGSTGVELRLVLTPSIEACLNPTSKQRSPQYVVLSFPAPLVNVLNKTHSFLASQRDRGRILANLKPFEVSVFFKANQRGKFTGVLSATIGNADDHVLLKASTQYVRQKRAPWRSGEATVEGERPPALDSAPWAALQQLKTKYFANAPSMQSHAAHFAHLLWAEEARTIEDLRMYDMRSVMFGREGRLYTVGVPGLAEKRPSVVVGDIILAQRSNGPSGQTHRGFVHTVRNEDICVSFHSSFDGGSRYNVRFEYNRVPIRRQHQALSVPSPSSQRLLFPQMADQGVPNTVSAQQLAGHVITFNTLVASNAAQIQAVKSILHLKPSAAPFVIFGPPGTGKTITVVEAIRQVLHRDPNAKILACAPSNSAADLLAQRLSVALSPAEMFRCNAVYRMRITLPEALVPYSLFQGNHFALPSLQKIESYRVIVSTCGNASFPFNIGMKTGHFSHIFVDEAGQASEPEVLQAIKIVSSLNTRVILSGDPKQLGPVIRSSIARHFGLETSYLERIMEGPLYKSAKAPNRAFVKLVKNFRSHEAILHYPNQQFYDNDLEACADRAVTDAFLGSPQLANPRFPIVFQHVSGENEREASSPSYFNILEATETVERIKLLLRGSAHRVHIAVITPYHAQGRKIRTLLKKSKIDGVTVCSVEQIQGQERPVIFISTVRSSRDLLSYDAKFTLGFVGNPRRFNVAVTRAKALLVVVGDSSVLSIDPVWRGFLNYIYRRGGWSGDAPGWDTSAAVDASFDYAAEIREAAATDIDALLARLAEGLDIEAEANIERPFEEED
ncbi:P-loop containing nucleoside triphosphate hydrolase protein [Epithele typhae]|uniref:P-loop containing nucleoside triphosphate hydrolase protein n=1 Tax=Epithele typhae TaxID=378194 RepID=UPI00200867A2|nr:P-loop containing nucleoside triphosphate hydrolase protein [Epithele typhae]KAH9930517.1 P-loop containing nucleoside triphosphate hydrolase protein [Epithele typhae]